LQQQQQKIDPFFFSFIPSRFQIKKIDIHLDL